MTLYDLKPRFQSLLRPLTLRLYARGTTANQVTLAAMLGSIALGLILTLGAAKWPGLWLLLPLFLLVRMALNAIDGMLAREHQQQSSLGAVLNEVGDVVSDLALYAPFLILPEAPVALICLALWAMTMTEFCGVLALSIGAPRRYDGPLGKSDRALVFGAYACALFLWPTLANHVWLLFLAVLLLSLLTCYQRCRRALAAVQ
ncbi:MAG: CDP-alcohol phosphatidyltransferase family protein [Neisseriaceae bacterium]|nr:CDP-alcohol phosphatidyltransferase family protein [Neisseriaceae bacterium]